jgi:hypothetical protein
MAQPRRFTLTHDEKSDLWVLRNEQTNRVIRTYGTKTEATRKGSLEQALGKEGGAVVIRKKGGVYEEERRFGRR